MKKKNKKLSLEEVRKLKRKQKLGRIARGVIQVASSAGFLAAALMAPAVVQLWDNKRTRQKEWYMREVLENLTCRKILHKEKSGTQTIYKLTEKGEDLALAYELQTLSIPKPFRWDGKWRLVISDVPERLKHVREELRSLLTGLGFVSIQKSVWAYPYQCSDVITILKRRFELGKEILYLEVDTLENDHWLRDIFFLR
ncbi:MAG TPA: hypothetical protein VI953_01590 [Candidatus Paceibacterota bacterium]